MPREIRKLARELLKLLRIEHLLCRPRAVPVAHAPRAATVPQLIEQNGSQRRHSRAPTDQHHLTGARLRVERTERPEKPQAVTRCSVKQERGARTAPVIRAIR